MSGRRIDDHSFFGGKGSADSVLPKGVHTKQYKSAEGAGGMSDYPDTSEAMLEDQKNSISKMKMQKQPDHKRA